MRSLDSQSTSGREGVGIAIIGNWLQHHFDYAKIVTIAETIGKEKFTMFHDYDVGRVILENSEIWEEFDAYIAHNPEIAGILLYAYGPVNHGIREKVAFINTVAPDIGKFLKTSLWWTKNYKEMWTHREKLKKVRKVMES